MDNFQSIQDWSNNKVTVLYPGGFKPITGGHINLIKRYLELDEVKLVKILIGSGIRNGITQDIAFDIANKLLQNYFDIEIEAVKWPSPILTAYKEIAEAKPGIYTLASSSKGNDYKRVQDFVLKHNNGKYPLPDGVKVIELPVDIEPLTYVGRTDENDGEPISASILRQDIINDDYENFKTNYPENSEDEIRYVWNKLASIVLNESVNKDKFYLHSLFESIIGGNNSDMGNLSTTSNYDRTTPGSYYKSTFPIVEDEDEEEIEQDNDEEINESHKFKLNEGGGAGHMLSPWEDLDLTFGDIKNIINKVLSGKLENITEKLDGSNLMVTVKDNNVYLARSTKHLKNYGENAIKWDNVRESMHPKLPEQIKEAFQMAMNDLQIILTNSNLNKIFLNGKRWLNIELINPKVENIIPYNTYQLRIHNIKELDEKGKIIKVYSKDNLLNDLDKIIKKIQSQKKLNNIHLISKTNTVILKNLKDLRLKKEGLIRKLQTTIMDKYKLDDENTIADYLAVRIISYIKEQGISDSELQKALVNRWAYGIKNPSIVKVLKPYDDKIKYKVKELDKKIDLQIGIYLDEIINIFSQLGILVLQNLDGIMANNPSETINKVRKKTQDAIQKIKTYIQKQDIINKEDFEKKVEYLKIQLRRLEKTGGLEGIAPLEGIVFEYKEQVYKLTGVFLPILKIINFFNFGKDK